MDIRNEVILLETFYIDNLADEELLIRKLSHYLSKVKPNKKRIVVQIITEPVIQETHK